MQFSGRLIVQTYIDTFVYFLPEIYNKTLSKFNKTKTADSEHTNDAPRVTSWVGQMVLERPIFLQKSCRYSEHILYCNTFYITKQYLRKLVSSSHLGSTLRVHINPLLVEGRSKNIDRIDLSLTVGHDAVARTKSG